MVQGVYIYTLASSENKKVLQGISRPFQTTKNASPDQFYLKEV